MNKKPIICHVTSAHPEGDIRVFHKMCVSMADEFNLILIVPNAKNRQEKNVEIIGFNSTFKSRFDRIKKCTKTNLKTRINRSCRHLSIT